MAQQRGVPNTYLECVKNGSDKFYCVIELGNGNSLVGYGPRGAGGDWRIETQAEGRKLVTQKKRKYDVVPISKISGRALNEAASHFKSAVGTDLKRDTGGNLVTDIGTAPAPAPAPGPIAAPKSRGDRKGVNPLNVWF